MLAVYVALALACVELVLQAYQWTKDAPYWGRRVS